MDVTLILLTMIMVYIVMYKGYNAQIELINIAGKPYKVAIILTVLMHLIGLFLVMHSIMFFLLIPSLCFIPFIHGLSMPKKIDYNFLKVNSTLTFIQQGQIYIYCLMMAIFLANSLTLEYFPPSYIVSILSLNTAHYLTYLLYIISCIQIVVAIKLYKGKNPFFFIKPVIISSLILLTLTEPFINWLWLSPDITNDPLSILQRPFFAFFQLGGYIFIFYFICMVISVSITLYSKLLTLRKS